MKNVNNFQIVKVQPHGVAWHLRDFLPILAWRCLQNCCLYKKGCKHFHKEFSGNVMVNFRSSDFSKKNFQK